MQIITHCDSATVAWEYVEKLDERELEGRRKEEKGLSDVDKQKLEELREDDEIVRIAKHLLLIFDGANAQFYASTRR